MGGAIILFSFILVQLEEPPHPPHPFQGGPSLRDLPFLVGDDVVAGLFGLPYLLLQGAHLLLGLLPNLHLPVLSKPYLGVELRHLRLSRRIDFGELDASGGEGPSYDEYRALLGYSLWQVGDRLGDALGDEVPRRRLHFVGHSPTTIAPPAPPRPPRLYLVARVVGSGVVLVVCIPPEHSREKTVSAHVCLPPSALRAHLLQLPRNHSTLVRPLRKSQRCWKAVTSAGRGPDVERLGVDEP